MIIIYPNIGRAKNSAKSLKSALQNITLSIAQNALARISGYRDWHDLEQSHKANHDIQALTLGDEKQLALELSLKLSVELNIEWATALYAISKAHIVGANLDNIEAYETVWLEILQKKHPFSNQRHSVGSIIKLKTAGRMGEPCYIRQYGKPTYLVSHVSSNTMVADFEITVPRIPLPLFIPSRLKFAYGYWLESDGAKVLFSRDYMPLWRIRDNKKPERLDPWLPISNLEKHWFWDGEDLPWQKQQRRDEEDARLHSFGITSLPKLADVLPIVIFNLKIETISFAVDALQTQQTMEEKQIADSEWVKLIGGGFSHSTAPFAMHPHDEKRAQEYLLQAKNAGLKLTDAMNHAREHLSNAQGWPIDIGKQVERVRKYYSGNLPQ